MIYAADVSSTGPRAAAPPPEPAALAARVLADNTQGGRRNVAEIKRDLDALDMRDPALGQAVRQNVEARLNPVERGQLASATYSVQAPDGRGLTIAADAMPMAEKFAQAPGSAERQTYDRFDRLWGDGNLRTDDTPAIEAGIRDMLARNLTLAQVEAERAAPPAPTGPSTATLIADLTQLGLDLTGIVDPTPISDGSNAVISVGRAFGSVFSGEGREALGHLGNGVLSAAGILPVLGDLAKAGKIGKWAQTVSDAVAAVASNPAARAALEPALRKIHDAVKAIPQGAIDALPGSARESLERMKGQLDEFFGAGVRGADETGAHLARLRGVLGDMPLNSGSLDELVKTGRMTMDEARDLAASVGWKDARGEWIYPPNDGFVSVARTTLQAGGQVRIDRYGGWIDESGKFQDTGRFFSPAGADYTSRALPPGTNASPPRTYEILSDLPVESGTATPWFGETGMGTQYRTAAGLNDLIKDGILREVK